MPEAGPEEKKLATKKRAGERRSRRQVMVDEGKPVDLPWVEAGGYLVGYLMEAGPVDNGGMGAGRISNSELRAWQTLSGIDLQPWEAQIIRRLSGEYAAESHRATDPNCPPPFAIVLDEVDRESVSEQLKNAFSTLIETRPQR